MKDKIRKKYLRQTKKHKKANSTVEILSKGRTPWQFPHTRYSGIFLIVLLFVDNLRDDREYKLILF